MSGERGIIIVLSFIQQFLKSKMEVILLFCLQGYMSFIKQKT